MDPCGSNNLLNERSAHGDGNTRHFLGGGNGAGAWIGRVLRGIGVVVRAAAPAEAVALVFERVHVPLVPHRDDAGEHALVRPAGERADPRRVRLEGQHHQLAHELDVVGVPPGVALDRLPVKVVAAAIAEGVGFEVRTPPQRCDRTLFCFDHDVIHDYERCDGLQHSVRNG